MKKIITGFLILISLKGFSQVPVTYAPMKGSYGWPYMKIDSGLAIPFRDTSKGRGINRAGLIVARPADSKPYYYNGLAWYELGTAIPGGAGTVYVDTVYKTGNVVFYNKGGVSYGFSLNTNLNIGSGYRWAIPNTNNIKTDFAGYGLIKDSTTNTNGITTKVDTSLLLTKLGAAAIYQTAGGGGGLQDLQSVLNEGATAVSSMTLLSSGFSDVLSTVATATHGLAIQVTAANVPSLNYNIAGNPGLLNADGITSARTWQLPDQSGTIALLSDIGGGGGGGSQTLQQVFDVEAGHALISGEDSIDVQSSDLHIVGENNGGVNMSLKNTPSSLSTGLVARGSGFLATTQDNTGSSVVSSLSTASNLAEIETQASGTLMKLSVWKDSLKIRNNTTDILKLNESNGKLSLPHYGVGAFQTGAHTFYLGVDAAGNVIEAEAVFKMTTTDRTAFVAEEGQMVYDTDLHKLYVFDGSVWQAAW